MPNRITLIVLAVVSAVFALLLNLLLNLAGNILTATLQPYASWIYWALGVVFVASVALIIVQMWLTATRSNDSATRVEMAARNGGQIEDSGVTAPAASTTSVKVEASGPGSAIRKSPVEIGSVKGEEQ